MAVRRRSILGDLAAEASRNQEPHPPRPGAFKPQVEALPSLRLVGQERDASAVIAPLATSASID